MKTKYCWLRIICTKCDYKLFHTNCSIKHNEDEKTSNDTKTKHSKVTCYFCFLELNSLETTIGQYNKNK